MDTASPNKRLRSLVMADRELGHMGQRQPSEAQYQLNHRGGGGLQCFKYEIRKVDPSHISNPAPAG